jgi:hypothetical protein
MLDPSLIYRFAFGSDAILADILGKFVLNRFSDECPNFPAWTCTLLVPAHQINYMIYIFVTKNDSILFPFLYLFLPIGHAAVDMAVNGSM